MIKFRTRKLLALTLALAVFSTSLIGVSAKSQNSEEKKVAPSSSYSASSDKNKADTSNTSDVKKAEVTKPVIKDTKVTTKATTKPTTKATKSKVKVVNPKVKKVINKQLTELGKKVDVIEASTNKIAIEIDSFIKVNTTGSAISVTPGAITTTDSAISTTGSAISVTKNKTAFVNSTSGKLKALLNRLSAVEKSLKAIDKKVVKDSSEQYKSLVSKLTAVKAKITKQLELLNSLKTTVKVKTLR